MSRDEHATWLDILQKLTLVGGAIAILYGAGVWTADIISMLSTKEYHNQDLEVRLEQKLQPIYEEVRESAAASRASELNTLPARIKNILEIQCSSGKPLPLDVQSILNRLLARYKELENREYLLGECIDGVHYSALEAAKLRHE